MRLGKKGSMLLMLVVVLLIIIFITFILNYPTLAKDTGKALAKSTGLVVDKGVSIVKNSETAKDAVNMTKEKARELIN